MYNNAGDSVTVKSNDDIHKLSKNSFKNKKNINNITNSFIYRDQIDRNVHANYFKAKNQNYRYINEYFTYLLYYSGKSLKELNGL
jgi:hypothetical protein